MFRADYERIKKGDAYIRESSRKDKMVHNDFEVIYGKRVAPIDGRLTENVLFINDNEPGNLEMIIYNYSPNYNKGDSI